MIYTVLNETRVRDFIAELEELQEKHGIAAIAGQIFCNGIGAPFQSFAAKEIILIADKKRADDLYKSIVEYSENSKGVKQIKNPIL